MRKFTLFFALCAGLVAGELEDGLRAYDDGKYANAKEQLTSACEDSKGLGCTYLGVLYQFGKGVQKDAATALKFYEKGCELKDAKGCSAAGGMYLAGEGVANDESKALTLLVKSCELGDANACNDAGAIHQSKQGYDNLKSALALFQKSCERGSSLGCQWRDDLARGRYSNYF